MQQEVALVSGTLKCVPDADEHLLMYGEKQGANAKQYLQPSVSNQGCIVVSIKRIVGEKRQKEFSTLLSLIARWILARQYFLLLVLVVYAHVQFDEQWTQQVGNVVD